MFIIGTLEFDISGFRGRLGRGVSPRLLAISERLRGPLTTVTLHDWPPRRFNLNANQNRKFALGPGEYPVIANFVRVSAAHFAIV